MERLLTCAEVAKRYGVKVGTVWEWVRTKKLAAIKIGKMYRIRQKDLDLFEKEG